MSGRALSSIDTVLLNYNSCKMRLVVTREPYRSRFRVRGILPCGTVLRTHQPSVLVNDARGFIRRTFSKPKNLSLPSVRTGPVTSFKCFSNGVGCGALRSFFAGAAFFASSDCACSPCRQLCFPSIPGQVRPYRSSLELAEERHGVQRICAARGVVSPSPRRRSCMTLSAEMMLLSLCPSHRRSGDDVMMPNDVRGRIEGSDALWKIRRGEVMFWLPKDGNSSATK